MSTQGREELTKFSSSKDNRFTGESFTVDPDKFCRSTTAKPAANQSPLKGAMQGRKGQIRSGCSQWWKRMGPEMALGFMAGLKGHPMQHFGNASAMVTMINQLRSKGCRS
eukprot:Skav204875  [mRNA]  locus=scaffold2602:30864:42269:+ [translate_table: standard]